MATFIAFATLFPKSHVYLLVPPIRLTAEWAAFFLFFITLLLAIFTKLNLTEWGTIGSMLTSTLCIYIGRLWYRRHRCYEVVQCAHDDYEDYEME